MACPQGHRKTARLIGSLDEQAHAMLSVLAKHQDISVTWMVRRAILQFTEQQARLAQQGILLHCIGTKAEPVFVEGAEG